MTQCPAVRVVRDRTIRVKVIDDCGLACTFCHNEGTPVTADNKDRTLLPFVSGPGRTGRVSVYSETNGADDGKLLVTAKGADSMRTLSVVVEPVDGAVDARDLEHRSDICGYPPRLPVDGDHTDPRRLVQLVAVWSGWLNALALAMVPFELVRQVPGSVDVVRSTATGSVSADGLISKRRALVGGYGASWEDAFHGLLG